MLGHIAFYSEYYSVTFSRGNETIRVAYSHS